MNNNTISIGDRIRVTVGGFTATGIVENVVDWGDSNQSDWYIEFRDEIDHKIRYVKEQYDHASIEVLDKNIPFQKILREY